MQNKLLGEFVTAQPRGLQYPLQGWVISESPLRIQCSDGSTYSCYGNPTVVTNPPPRPLALSWCDDHLNPCCLHWLRMG
jgi:hypothetical protein